MEMNKDELAILKEKEKELLCYFADFCDQHNLAYRLSEGTLIGAVRHKGFIPWDDDVDVEMPLEDYNKLIAISSTIDPRYFFQSIDTEPGYIYPWAKLRMNGTAFVEKTLAYLPINQGIYIDIFPMIKASPSAFKRKNAHRIERILYARIDTGLNLERSKAKKFVAAFLTGLLTFFATPHKACQKLMRHYKRMNDRSKTSEVYFPVWFDQIVRPYKTKLIKLPFENVLFNCPADYDEVLKAEYGDYMTPPPPDQREPHHYLAFYSFESPYSPMK